jgi:hypothetical protein
MNEHVQGGRDGKFSAVLYGPPGTGKTTLLQAVAKSADVPFVEVTPSDIIVAGGEQVEARARVVFEALSLLTRSVILFDEFEPVVGRRTAGGAQPSSVFAFLTPGMLPKLKKLHDRATKQRVAYALATNLLVDVDPAARRPGRFDLEIAVLHADVLSRMGRFAFELVRPVKERKEQTKGAKGKASGDKKRGSGRGAPDTNLVELDRIMDDVQEADRFVEVVRKSGRAQVLELTGKGRLLWQDEGWPTLEYIQRGGQGLILFKAVKGEFAAHAETLERVVKAIRTVGIEEERQRELADWKALESWERDLSRRTGWGQAKRMGTAEYYRRGKASPVGRVKVQRQRSSSDERRSRP